MAVWSDDPRLWAKLDYLGLIPVSEVFSGAHCTGRFYLVPAHHPRWRLALVVERIPPRRWPCRRRIRLKNRGEPKLS